MQLTLGVVSRLKETLEKEQEVEVMESGAEAPRRTKWRPIDSGRYIDRLSR